MRMSADPPVYRQVAELLRERITAGWYPEVLPTETLLATELGVHQFVLRLALGALSGEGLGVPLLFTDGRIHRADQFAIIGDVHGGTHGVGPDRPRSS